MEALVKEVAIALQEAIVRNEPTRDKLGFAIRVVCSQNPGTSRLALEEAIEHANDLSSRMLAWERAQRAR